MYKFLEIYNLQRLKHDETENLNRPITSKEVASVIIAPPPSRHQQEKPRNRSSQDNSTKNLKKKQ